MTEEKSYLNELKETQDDDLDFITGGAQINTNIGDEFKKTFNTQPCDCGKFESAISKCSINICDNCIWARAPMENTTVTYCMKQRINLK